MMINHFAMQKSNVSAVREEMISRETLVCPKPVRVGEFSYSAADSIRTLRCILSHQTEISESAARADLLDILLLKGGSHGVQSFCTEEDSLPSFFSGSPPSRVSNPLIKDARFIKKKHDSPLSQLQRSITGPGSPSSYAKKGGYTSASFGNSPVVRIEGFACVNRGGRNSAVSARA